jgi:ribosomal-protein-alanine N-acetyltransferase
MIPHFLGSTTMPEPWRPPTIETERLILRPLDESDCDAVFRYAANPNMTRYTLWETHRSPADSLFFVRDYARSRYLEQVPEPLGILLKDEPERGVIGGLGCFWISQSDGVMELGYNVGEPDWGRGIAVEASAALIDYAFAEYEVYRIQTRIIEGNEASLRVAMKLGMHHDGTLRGFLFRRGRHVDVQICSLLRPEREVRKRHPTSDLSR